MKISQIVALVNLSKAMNLNPDQIPSRPVTSMLIQTNEDYDIPIESIHSDSNSTDEIGEGIICSVSAHFKDPNFDQILEDLDDFHFANQQKVDVSHIGNLSFA